MAFYQNACRFSYGGCDSFFIEEDESKLSARREDARERARADARARQRVIAGELSRVTADEYQEDVLDHMQHMEVETLPDVNSIDIQTEIEWFMRPYLLDFLVEAHAAFALKPDTLYLTINLLDRYCSRRIVYKRHYQLVGCAALLIAAKYGDKKERVPQIKELKSMCCSLYEDEMFTQMEWHVLQTLDWVIGHPTVDSFLQMAISEAPYDQEIEHMTWYLSELAFFHKEFVSTMPSVMARSALYLARWILGRPQSASTDWWASYDPWTVNRLYLHMHQPSPVVSKKYATQNLSSSSMTAQLFLQRQAELERSRMLAPPSPVHVEQLDGEKTYLDVHGNPQTPQKPIGGATFVHGLYTPPITPSTPEGEHTYNAEYAKQQMQVSHMCPSTPSPPSTSGADQLQPYHYQSRPHAEISPSYSQ